MRTEVYFKNRIRRQILWNGQDLVFTRYGQNSYHEIDYSKIDKQFEFKGIFHDGGGYGGMLNITIYERDGARTITKMKPMILALYEDAKDIQMDDEVVIGGSKYLVTDKTNIKGLNIAYEISLEIVDFKEQ